MRKNGYTLAEALIAMVVIGVIAAITLPLANKFMPDTNKVMYLKTYDAVVEATLGMVSSTQLYPIISGNGANNIDYTNYPLANTENVEINGFDSEAGSQKYCRLLAYLIGGTENGAEPVCSLETDSPDMVNWDGTPSFTTQNGVDFFVNTHTGIANNLVEYNTFVFFDIDGVDRGNNCIYNAVACTQPDRFVLQVAADGQVFVSDAMGNEYLRTRSNYRVNRDLVHPLLAAEVDINPMDIDWINNGPNRPELPEGQAYADWVRVDNLRATFANGVYCEIVDANGGYDQQRHVYWHQEAQAWVELVGTYRVNSGDYSYPSYDGEDADKIVQQSLW